MFYSNTIKFYQLTWQKVQITTWWLDLIRLMLVGLSAWRKAEIQNLTTNQHQSSVQLYKQRNRSIHVHVQCKRRICSHNSVSPCTCLLAVMFHRWMPSLKCIAYYTIRPKIEKVQKFTKLVLKSHSTSTAILVLQVFTTSIDHILLLTLLTAWCHAPLSQWTAQQISLNARL